MKSYKTQEEVDADLVNGDLKIRGGSVIFNCSIRIRGNINAGNIKAQDIDARNINAGDIEAQDIDARNINAGDIEAQDIRAQDIDAEDIYAIDVYARNIKAQNIDARNIKAQNIDARNIKAQNIIYTGSFEVSGSLDCKSQKKIKGE